MTRKWAGLGRERHDGLKVAVMSIALLAFVVAWIAFAAGHAPSTADSVVLAGGAATTDRAGAATPAQATVDPSGAATPAPTVTPSAASGPPTPAPVRRRTTRGS